MEKFKAGEAKAPKSTREKVGKEKTAEEEEKERQELIKVLDSIPSFTPEELAMLEKSSTEKPN